MLYSTEQGRLCPECCRPVAQCSCRRSTVVPRSDGIVRVSRETKGRRGKCVTLIRGIALDGEALSQLAKTLRTLCGSGGTVKEGIIELQGVHRQRVSKQLTKQGWVVKQVGG